MNKTKHINPLLKSREALLSKSHKDLPVQRIAPKRAIGTNERCGQERTDASKPNNTGKGIPIQADMQTSVAASRLMTNMGRSKTSSGDPTTGATPRNTANSECQSVFGRRLDEGVAVQGLLDFGGIDEIGRDGANTVETAKSTTPTEGADGPARNTFGLRKGTRILTCGGYVRIEDCLDREFRTS